MAHRHLLHRLGDRRRHHRALGQSCSWESQQVPQKRCKESWFLTSWKGFSCCKVRELISKGTLAHFPLGVAGSDRHDGFFMQRGGETAKRGGGYSSKLPWRESLDCDRQMVRTVSLLDRATARVNGKPTALCVNRIHEVLLTRKCFCAIRSGIVQYPSASNAEQVGFSLGFLQVGLRDSVAGAWNIDCHFIDRFSVLTKPSSWVLIKR